MEPTTSATAEPATTGSGATGSATETSSVSDATTGDTTGGEPASCCSIPDVANAEVSGTTPLGSVSLTWSWYGIVGGECGGASIHVFADPGQLATVDGPWLMISLQKIGPVMGEADAVFTITDEEGQQASVEGKVSIGAIDEGHPPWVCVPGEPVVETASRADLSFALVADGWEVAGTIEAVYCPQLSVFCP